jgi:hypothetical protein
MKGKLTILALGAAVASAGVLFVASRPTGSEEAPATSAAGAEESAGSGFLGAAEASVKKTEAQPASSSGPALALAAETTARQREDQINAQFRSMASQGVTFALAQVRQLPDATSRDMAMLALLGEWSGLSVAELVQQGDLGRFGVAGALALQLMNEGQIPPQEAVAMADEFLNGGQRVGVLARAAEKLAATDPTTALSFGEGLTDWEQTRFLSRFVAGWASASPQEAKAWVAQFPDESTRAMLTGRVLAEQARMDPSGAGRTFLEAPPGDPRVRARTARRIAEGWAAQDTLGAMQWADNLSDETDRNAARDGIRRAAPVGIGARLSRSEDGLPVLQDLVPGSPASLSGQLRSGDRVLSVADANGSWVSARNLPIGDVARLIQGEPNTAVSLQVQPADGSAPRVVTVAREQIIHRPGS